MTTLQEYIDHNASRLMHQMSCRQLSDLHELKNLSYWLKLINDRRKLQAVKAVTVALLILGSDIPLQIPNPTKAPVCVEYCEAVG